MKFKVRSIPYGSLPYDNIDAVSRMMVKLYEHMPFLPHLPRLNANDTIAFRTLDGIPGVTVNGDKVSLKVGTEEYKKGLVKLDKAFNTPSFESLEPYAISSVYLERFLHLISKSKTSHACVNIWGPFTVSQKLMGLTDDQFLSDKSFRKLFIQSVTVKALWMIEQIKKANPKTVPIIVLEEPLLCRIGVIKKENEDITAELIITLMSRVIEKIKSAGAVVAVHCMEKCDWTVAIKAGADIISFDAYNNPNNLRIIPEQVGKFLENGGKINWCIMPVMTESIVKSMTLDDLTRRFVSTMEGLVNSGVHPKLVYNSSLVSIQGDVEKLPIIFAEKALMLTSQLTKRIPVVG